MWHMIAEAEKIVDLMQLHNDDDGYFALNTCRP